MLRTFCLFLFHSNQRHSRTQSGTDFILFYFGFVGRRPFLFARLLRKPPHYNHSPHFVAVLRHSIFILIFTLFLTPKTLLICPHHTIPAPHQTPTNHNPTIGTNQHPTTNFHHNSNEQQRKEANSISSSSYLLGRHITSPHPQHTLAPYTHPPRPHLPSQSTANLHALHHRPFLAHLAFLFHNGL